MRNSGGNTWEAIVGAGGVTSYKVVKLWEVVALQEVVVVAGHGEETQGMEPKFKLLEIPNLKTSQSDWW